MKVEEVREIFKGCEIISTLEGDIKNLDKIEYKCFCGYIFIKTIKDYKRGKQCRKCMEKLFPSKQEFINFLSSDQDCDISEIEERNGEKIVWRKFPGGILSEKGELKNPVGKAKNMYEDGKITISNYKIRYGKLVARIFKIPNWEKLSFLDEKGGGNYVLIHKNKDDKDNSVNNLEIVDKGKIISMNMEGNLNQSGNRLQKIENKMENLNNKYETIRRLNQTIILNADDLTDFKTINFFDNNILFLRDGRIWNKDKFIKPSTVDNILICNIDNNVYKIDRLICIAFHPIEGKNSYEDYNNLEINYKDKNKFNIFENNLEWIEKDKNIDSIKSFDIKDFNGSSILNEFIGYVFLIDGRIWDGNKFVKPSKVNGYYRFILSTDQIKSYRWHRLVCMAFHPIEGKNKLQDYDTLEVNHIDGNTLNNHSNNLEWVTPSQNMQHAVASGLINKRCQQVLQYNKTTGEFIKEYPSIAEAARQTKEKEHMIRTTCRGKGKSSIYKWEFKDKAKADEFSKKFSKLNIN